MHSGIVRLYLISVQGIRVPLPVVVFVYLYTCNVGLPTSYVTPGATVARGVTRGAAYGVSKVWCAGDRGCGTLVHVT